MSPVRCRNTIASLIVSLLVSALLALGGSAQAATFRWPDKQINMAYQDKPIQDVLREFFAGLGAPVVISEQLRGNVTGRFDAPAKKFFDDLKSVFGLLCFYDGSVFYIYDPSEAVSRVIALRRVDPERFRRSLEAMGAISPEFALRIQDAERLVSVSGPPRYVEVVEDIANKLNDSRNGTARPARTPLPSATEPYQPLEATFRVFELRHGWAQDTTMAVGGREIVVPGVASTLRKLMGNYTHGIDPGASGGLVGQARRSTIDKLRGSGLRRHDAPPAVAPEADSRGPAGPAFAEAGNPMAMVNISLPRIEADARTNSVIVHDLPDRMARYDNLIAALDKRSSMIQIEATIVDVSTDAIERLGVDFGQGGVTVAIGRGVGSADSAFRNNGANFATQAAQGFLNTGGAPLSGLSTVVGNMGRYFLAQVNLLASEGKAFIHSSPSVLTMNNSEAVLENTQTFYVRVAGRDDVDLFDVTSGTILRVTPVSVLENGKQQIKLAVRIEDGSITGQFVDNIPIVQRSTVGTRALINEGQSLLVGGYAYSIDNSVVTKIPLLGDIPALGALFTFTNKQVKRVERMFMITPRLVSL